MKPIEKILKLLMLVACAGLAARVRAGLAGHPYAEGPLELVGEGDGDDEVAPAAYDAHGHEQQQSAPHRRRAHSSANRDVHRHRARDSGSTRRRY